MTRPTLNANRRDLGVALAGVLVAFTALVSLPGGYAPASLFDFRSASFFPLLLALALAALSLLHGLAACRGTTSRAEGGAVEAPGRAVAAAVTLAAYGLLVYGIGMVPASILAVTALAVVLGSRAWLTIAILALLLPVVIHYFFRELLYVLLPSGEWL